MGLNILGFATSIKTDNLSELTDLLNIEITDVLCSSTFEDAISNNMEEDEIFLTTTKHGSIITATESFPMFKVSMLPLTFNQNKLLKFMYGETSMVFFFEYLENGKVSRRKDVENGEIIDDIGKALPFEFSGIEIDEVIMEYMKHVSGENVYTLEPDHVSTKYKYIGLKQKLIEPIDNKNQILNQKINIKKPWWKIW